MYKWSHKHDGIRVRRIGTFPFRPVLFTTCLYDPVKTRLSESEADAEESQSQARN